MENGTENIRKDLRVISEKYQGKVNFEEWNKNDSEKAQSVTMLRAIMTFRIEQ